MRNKEERGYWIIVVILLITAICLIWFSKASGEDQEPPQLSEKDLLRVLGPGSPEILDRLKKDNFLDNACIKFGELNKRGILCLSLDDGYFFEIREENVHGGLQVIQSKAFGRTTDENSDVFIYKLVSWYKGTYTQMTFADEKYLSVEWDEKAYLTMFDEVYEAALKKDYKPYEGPVTQFWFFYDILVNSEGGD